MIKKFKASGCLQIKEEIYQAPDSVFRRMSQSADILKKATFAMGCFWGADCYFGCAPGVVRTCVGYTGGTLQNPTYHNLGDHTEAINIDYDPNCTSYEKLLAVFWNFHEPTIPQKTQYMSAVFYHDEEQRKIAEESKTEQENKLKKPVSTKILPSKTFYAAEGYHQKYNLVMFHPRLVSSLGLYGEKLVTSSVAARLCGYVTGNGTLEAFEKECPSLGLSSEDADYVRKQIRSPNPIAC